MAAAEACFHCALPIPANCDISVEIGGEPRPVCCPGCRAVAALIRDAGFENYYDKRDVPDPGRAARRGRRELGRIRSADMLDAFALEANGKAEATFYVGGMYCAACSWLIDSTLRARPASRVPT